ALAAWRRAAGEPRPGAAALSAHAPGRDRRGLFVELRTRRRTLAQRLRLPERRAVRLEAELACPAAPRARWAARSSRRPLRTRSRIAAARPVARARRVHR